jgi:hypothetical protein
MDNPESNFMVQLGLNYGQRVIKEGERGLAKYLPVLRDTTRYFRVNNVYVREKLKMIFFPFNKTFGRTEFRIGQDMDDSVSPHGLSVLPPTDDVWAFDLYIPLMAVITYVTLCGFARGLSTDRLSADYLASVLTSQLFWIGVEVCVVKVARYALAAPQNLALLDILSLCGYKYVAVCVLVLLGEVLGVPNPFFAILVVYCCVAVCLFVYRYVVCSYSRDGKPPRAAAPLIYGCAALQAPLIMWFGTRVA